MHATGPDHHGGHRFERNDLPVGLQVVGPQHADAGVLRLMALLEDVIGFDQQAPIG